MKGEKSYNNAKIYKLTSTVDDNYYIGSTCTSLTVRLFQHKQDSKRKPEIKVYKWMNDVGLENIKIILINNEFVCDNVDQLHREEDTYIMMYRHEENCMNSRRAYTTKQEKNEQIKKYYEENSDIINEKRKIYRKEHPDIIIEKNKKYYEEKSEYIKEKISCDVCGCMISRSNMSGHKKSFKHQNNLKAKTMY